MKVLRIKNLREVFYSIMRQFESGIKVSFSDLNIKDSRYDVIIGDTSKLETDFDFVKLFSNLRKQLNNSDTIVLTIMDGISFKISKDSINSEYYIIDNAQILLNYILFNSFINTKVVRINIFDDNSKLLQRININMNKKVEEESRFFIEKMCNYIDSVEKISNKINDLIYELDESEILIANDNRRLNFSVINV